jgi:hypothetical protein
VTQRRGYRTNNMAWQRTPTAGPSNNGYGGVPLTYALTTQETNLLNPGRILPVNQTINVSNRPSIGGPPIDANINF